MTLPQNPVITLNQKRGIKPAKKDEIRFQLLADSCSQPRGASSCRMGRAWTNIASRTAAALCRVSCSCWISRVCWQTNTSETNCAISVSMILQRRVLASSAVAAFPVLVGADLSSVLTVRMPLCRGREEGCHDQQCAWESPEQHHGGSAHLPPALLCHGPAGCQSCESRCG